MAGITDMADKVSTIRRKRPAGVAKHGVPKHLLLRKSLVDAIQAIADQKEATWIATAEEILTSNPEVQRYLQNGATT